MTKKELSAKIAERMPGSVEVSLPERGGSHTPPLFRVPKFSEAGAGDGWEVTEPIVMLMRDKANPNSRPKEVIVSPDGTILSQQG